MKKKTVNAENPDALQDAVKAALGDSLAKLEKTPAAVTRGMERILQDACKTAAGFPDPVASAVRMVRVACGLKGNVTEKKLKS